MSMIFNFLCDLQRIVYDNEYLFNTLNLNVYDIEFSVCLRELPMILNFLSV